VTDACAKARRDRHRPRPHPDALLGYARGSTNLTLLMLTMTPLRTWL
jgi:hypothetical protein